MPRIVEGSLSATGLKFAIVTSRFNHFVADKLLAGALDALVRHGASEDDIEVYRTPGSFELPGAAQKVVASKRHDAVICLGVLIRGDTPHFEYISAEVTKGIAQVGMDAGVPVIYGVVTADTLEQAIDRAGTKSGNKGFDAAAAAIEMANLYAAIKAKG